MIPVQSEPTQIFNRFLGSAGLDARRVDIFHAQNDFTYLTAGREASDEIRSRIADVLCARRRRRQSAYDILVRINGHSISRKEKAKTRKEKLGDFSAESTGL